MRYQHYFTNKQYYAEALMLFMMYMYRISISESIQFFRVIENSTPNKTLHIRGADNVTYCSLFLLVFPLNSGAVLSINNNWGKYDLTKIMDVCNYNRVRLITDCYACSSDTPDNISKNIYVWELVLSRTKDPLKQK